MRDTSAEAHQVQLAAIRRISHLQRLEHAFKLSAVMRGLRLAGLRTRYPDLTELALVELLVGRSLRPVPPAADTA